MHHCRFLMEHVIKKVESIIGIVKSTYTQDELNLNHSNDFISDLVQILPNIMTFFNQLANHLKVIVDANVANADDTAASMNLAACEQLYTEETNYVKVCFGLCMRLLAGLYSWSAFESEENVNILQGMLTYMISIAHEIEFIDHYSLSILASDSLKAIVPDDHLVAANVTVSQMALAGIHSIMANAKVVLDLRSAIYMFTLIKSLVKHLDDPRAYAKYVGQICHDFLSKQWYDQYGSEERGTQCNVLLDTLLRGYFKDRKFAFIRAHINWIDEEVKEFLPNKNTPFNTFPCFNRLEYAN